MSYLNALISDLRNRKVWPIAAALVAALVAVPVLLHRSPAPVPTPNPTVALPVTSPKGVPTVSVAADAAQVSLTGKGRDPFIQQKLASATPAAAGSALTGAASTAAAAVSKVVSTATGGATPNRAGGAKASAARAGGTTATGTRTTGDSNYAGSGIVAPPAAPGGSTASSSKPLAPSSPPPAPSGLEPREHYAVTLAITDSNGGFTTVDPYERLGAIRSDSAPLLVQLGVLSGGKKVMFAVAPGATPSGPGTCVPGPLDCEMLAIAPGANETVAGPTGAPVTFQVTGVTAVRDASKAAAATARTTADATGRGLLASWQRAAFSLFPYVPSQGVVVDERNLIVGGN